MAGNTFGGIFTVTTFGESHGPGLGAVVDGCPPGVPLDRALIQRDLDRRRPGQSAATTSRAEADQVEILSGVFEGVTTGTPIGLLIRNEDHRSGAYDHLRDLFRPGHADLGFFLKFGHRDHRGGGRSSGRETAARVAAGAVARAVLSGFGATIRGFTVQVGGIRAEKFFPDTAEENPLRCPDPAAAEAMMALILECKEEGDSVGGGFVSSIDTTTVNHAGGWAATLITNNLGVSISHVFGNANFGPGGVLRSEATVDDATLVRAARDGDIDAFEAIVRRIWEQTDALGNMYIWQVLLSF